MNHSDSFCDICVYAVENLEWNKYILQGMGGSQDAGCSLDFVPGDDGCNEMRTGNCSARKR